MKRSLALSLAALMLAVPSVSASPWMQPRGDAAATGFQAEEGPQHPDVALDVPLPDRRPIGDNPGPMILEDRVLLITERLDEDGTEDGNLVSVNLSTGNVSRLARFPFTARNTMATDGHTVFLTEPGQVRAIPLDEEGFEWTWTWEASPGPDEEENRSQPGELESCQWIRHEPETVTVLCELDRPDGMVPANVQAQDDLLVARIDASTGETLWTWEAPQDPDAEGADGRSAPSYGLGLAVSGPRVVAVTMQVLNYVSDPLTAGQVRVEAWGLAKPADADERLVWDWASPPANRSSAHTPGPVDESAGSEEQMYAGNPAASGDAVYVKAQRIHKLNLGNGNHLWARSIGDEDFQQGLITGTALALGPDHVYATTSQTAYRIGQDDPEAGWARSLNLSRQKGFSEDPIVTPSSLYTVALPTETRGEVVYAFDTEDGSIRWTHEVPHNFLKFSVGEGLYVYTDQGDPSEDVPASLVVLGRTDASPAPQADVSSTYPAPGEEVAVNLSGSEEGLQGPVTRYKAIWGDGTNTTWQANPAFNHTYDEPGDAQARFLVGNEAGQTNSTTVTFHVGEEEPTEPSWLAQRFAKGNQDMTFGVLGLAVALGGGAIGVARRKRKKSLLEQELEALEQGFEETREQPSECEALLDNRKARARSLALDHKLDEEQVTIIENRAEELRSTLRREALEDEFGFLPHSLVVKARQMVEDGQVTSLERDAFLQAVEDDEMLTSQQKANVRERIEAWFARDAGGGTG